eukprot:ANDGO_01649.mRNA.1 hypothetical protein
MSSYLNARLSWTSKATVEHTLQNDECISSFLRKLVDLRNKQNALILLQTPFYLPLQFDSSFRVSDLTSTFSSRISYESNKQIAYVASTEKPQSPRNGASASGEFQEEKTDFFRYSYELRNPDAASGLHAASCRIGNLDFLIRHIRFAGGPEAHRAHAEFRSLLQSNRAFSARIGGVKGSQPAEVLQNALQQINDSGSDESKRKVASDRLQILLALSEIDRQLFAEPDAHAHSGSGSGHGGVQRRSSMDEISALEESTVLSMQAAERQVILLKSFCSEDDNRFAIKALDWESDIVYASGARAPPWRELKGDLGYMYAKTWDKDTLFVVASTTGFYVARGFVTGEDGVDKMDYEPQSARFGSLDTLLKGVSPHFAKTIDQQDFIFFDRPMTSSPSSLRSSPGAGNNTPTFMREDAFAAAAPPLVQKPMGATGRRGRSYSVREGPGSNGPGARNRSISVHSRTGSSDSISSMDGSGGPPSPTGSNNSSGSQFVPIQGGGSRPSNRQITAVRDRDDDPYSPAASSSPRSSGSSFRSMRDSMKSPSGSNKKKKEDEDKMALGSPNAGGSPAKSARKLKKNMLEGKEEVFEDEVSIAQVHREESSRAAEVCPDIAQINKLVKFLKGGNMSATIIALSTLREYDLSARSYQKALKDVGGIDPLLGLVGSGEPKLAQGCAEVLCAVSKHPLVQFEIVEQDGIETLVSLISSDSKAPPEVRAFAAETLGNCATFGITAGRIRRAGGIKKLVQLIQVPISPSSVFLEAADGTGGVSSPSRKNASNSSYVALLNLSIIRSACFALHRIACRSDHNREAIRVAQGIPVMIEGAWKKGLKVPEGDDAAAVQFQTYREQAVEHAAGCLAECLKLVHVRPIFVEHRGISRAVDMIVSVANSTRCKSYISTCISYGAFHDTTREIVRSHKGIPPIASLLNKRQDDPDEVYEAGLVAATSAIRELSKWHKAVPDLIECGAMGQIISLLGSPREAVQSNIAIAVANCAKNDTARTAIRSAGGITTIVRLLHSTNRGLLASVCESIGELAEDETNRKTIDEEDGLRLLWSLLRHEDLAVRSQAAFAVARCVRTPDAAGAIGRTFVNGLSVLVRLLRNPEASWDISSQSSGQHEKLPNSRVLRSSPLTQARLGNSLQRQSSNRFNSDAVSSPVFQRWQQIWEGDVDWSSEWVAVQAASCAAVGQMCCNVENLSVLVEEGCLEAVAVMVQCAAMACKETFSKRPPFAPFLKALSLGEIQPAAIDADDDDSESNKGSKSAKISQDKDTSKDSQKDAQKDAQKEKEKEKEKEKAKLQQQQPTHPQTVPNVDRWMSAQLKDLAMLLENVSFAVSVAASSESNRRQLGSLNAVIPLVEFLRFPYSALPDMAHVPESWVSYGLLKEVVSKMHRVHRHAALAMRQLSEDEDNARALRDANAVSMLVDLIQVDEEALQEACAKAVENIRKAHIASAQNKKASSNKQVS